VVHVSDSLRFYHHGDTRLFSGMKLIAELRKPSVGAVGVALTGERCTSSPELEKC